MATKDSSSHDYYVIAAMLLAVLLYFFVSHYLWYWLTYDLRDGRWVCDLITNGSAQLASGTVPLAGIEGRFIWAASAFVLLLVLVAVVSVSTYVLLSTLKQWRKLVGTMVSILLVAVLLVAVCTIETDYKHYMQVIFFDGECTFACSRVSGFDFVRYLLVLMQTNASTATLNGIAVLEQFLPLLVLACNLLLIAALLSLVAHNRRQSLSGEILIPRFAHFRLLLFLGSAMFTTIALYHLSQYGWLAQILQTYKNPGVEALRQIQRGVTLYIGTMNSIAIVLLFFPPGWILWRRAQLLCQAELPEQSRQARTDWLAEKQLTLFAGPTMRIIVAVAPLLVSGAIMLLEKALM
jgi:hypothetical protein